MNSSAPFAFLFTARHAIEAYVVFYSSALFPLIFSQNQKTLITREPELQNYQTIVYSYSSRLRLSASSIKVLCYKSGRDGVAGC